MEISRGHRHSLLLGHNHNSLTLGNMYHSLAAALALGEGVRTGMGGETHPVSHLSCPLSSTGLKETEPTGKQGV